MSVIVKDVVFGVPRAVIFISYRLLGLAVVSIMPKKSQ